MVEKSCPQQVLDVRGIRYFRAPRLIPLGPNGGDPEEVIVAEGNQMAWDMSPLEIGEFLSALGITDQPVGMYYTDEKPSGGVCPKPGIMPSVEAEMRNEVSYLSIWRLYSCVIGHIRQAQREKTAAYFSQEHFGCLGCAFYLGFLKPQLHGVACLVSTGMTNLFKGERFLESPEAAHTFFETVDPRPAPARYCVFKPLDIIDRGQTPELVTFFADAETISGLAPLASFVTNDYHAVCSPFGAGCTSLVAWPLKFLERGELKAVLGGFDPVARRFISPGDMTFTVSLGLFRRMVRRWRESFLATHSWKLVRKRIEESKNAKLTSRKDQEPFAFVRRVLRRIRSGSK
jgi:uncharacterized protein (DUF169 family)